MQAPRDTALSRAIKVARADRTRRAFALELDITEVTLWRYETGRRHPDSRKEIAALHRAGVPLDLLLDHAQAPVAVAR